MNFEVDPAQWRDGCIRRIVTIDQTAGARLDHSRRSNIGEAAMLDESRSPEKQQPLELIPDSPYESRYEFITKLANRLWVQRGRPLGSPDVDWFAAEKAVYASLAASGMIIPSSDDPHNITEEIHRWMKADSEASS